ncbi:MAG: DUF4388 domain-containing protein [Pyrinomonadaceae bacterium]|nr:DUF4388 domain-containing protein [Pyrinomonadaceae bacterium]
MQSPRFMVLTGHLNDYPLSDLIGILHHQRKTGRLLIEYPHRHGVFYFREGNLVDAQLDNLSGLQAICVAVSQPNAAFNFNPLIQPPRQSLDPSSQKVILELFGCWSEEPLPITATGTSNPALPLPASPPPAVALPVDDEQRLRTLPGGGQPGLLEAPGVVLALPPAPVTHGLSHPGRRRMLLAGGAACLLLLSLSVVLALTDRIGRRGVATATAGGLAPPAQESEDASANAASVPVAGAPADVAQSDSPSLPPPVIKETRGKSRKLNREPAKETSLITSPAQANEAEGATRGVPAAAATTTTKPNERNTAAQQPATAAADGEAVRVVMEIENGRVVRAAVANSRPGMQAYEAFALRIARGRRYPAKAGGQETMVIKVNPPQP